jgi:hypothetical protein
MFGHNNQMQDHTDNNQASAPADVDTTTHDPLAGVTVAPTSSPSTADTGNLELPGSTTYPGSINPPAPITDDTAAPAPAVSTPMTPSAAPAPIAGSPDLISIKQEALQHLAPLVDHLDQTPEERFRTTMMMIQATDDQSKIKIAYEAAQQIADEKVRAQALLDVVNEINYFTQHKQ